MKWKQLSQAIQSLLCVMTLLFCAKPIPVIASEDPVVMLKRVTDQVMRTLKQNQDSYRSNPTKIYGLVNGFIVPHADFEEMARWIVGKNAWTRASPHTQQVFVQALKNLVIRTYSRSLLNYTNHNIDFLPLRESPNNKKRIQVSSIVRDGSRVLRLDYRLIDSTSGWKVYDIIIEGVSLTQGYRAQFSDDVRRNGVEGALARMRQQDDKP